MFKQVRFMIVCGFATVLASMESGAQSPAVAPPAVSAITVEGTEIVVALADGRSLRSKDLAGAVLDARFEGQPVKLRITGVERDPEDRSGTVWLHSFESRGADGTWSNVCDPGPDGRKQGFPLQGADGGVEFTCSAGGIGKCVRFGYRPWTTSADGKSLAPQHAACVRLLRGDYGGMGQPFTNNGMLVDIYDTQGIQESDQDPSLSFEAGWSAEGAVCVHHARVKANVTLAQLEAQFPRLEGRTGAICTEAFARSLGATLFNRSKD